MIVDSIKAVVCRALAYVLDKLFKITPLAADGNAASAVPGVVPVTGVLAAREHTAPTRVQWVVRWVYNRFSHESTLYRLVVRGRQLALPDPDFNTSASALGG